MQYDDIRAKMRTAVRWAALGTLAELAALEIAAPRGTAGLAALEAGFYDLTPLQQEWASKAARRYAEAQEKQWRRYNESMFEKEEK